MTENDFWVEPADYTTDFNDLRKIRETVFVIEQNVPIEEEWDELDPQCYHVIARDRNKQPIGTGRLTPAHKIGRMAVLAPWRNKGVGDALMVTLIDQARQRGWTEVSLNAQVQAMSFYARHGFEPYGERFTEAGIEHLAMRRTLAPLQPPERNAPTLRATEPRREFDTLDEALQASCALVRTARREVWINTGHLEHSLYSQPALVEAFRSFATAGRGCAVKILLQEPANLSHSGHLLLALAQRLPSVFALRYPAEPTEQNEPSAFLINDQDGYVFRQAGNRWEGNWSPCLPARAKQLQAQFERQWEHALPFSELRALGI